MSEQRTTKTIDLLKQLEQAFPPAGDHKHTLEYVRFGSDADGWKDGLKLTVTYPLPAPHNYMVDDSILIEASDLKKPTATIVRELVNLISHARDLVIQQLPPTRPQSCTDCGCEAEPPPVEPHRMRM
ncbi:MAG: hypothetical protein WCD70_10220 [Alphaproteobacteria bacterium]